MKILSFGHALPKQSVTNDQLAAILDTSDEWINTHTGIRSRHIMSGDETLAKLGASAAHMALTRAAAEPSALDYILCSTTCGDMTFPSTACLIQRELGASCPALDCNAGCSGFLYALDMADALIASGKARTVLVVAAERITRQADWNDRGTCVLFGDAVGAALCAQGEGLIDLRVTAQGDPEPLHGWSDGGNCPFDDNIPKRQPLYMNGQEIFKFAVTHSCRDLETLLERNGVAADAVDYYVLHQANKRILDAVRVRLKQPEERFPVNIMTHGNASSACIPVLLSEMTADGRLRRGQLLALSAFGAGLTTGAALLRY